MQNDERLTYDVGTAAKLMGLSRNAMYQAVRQGQIPCLKVGKRLLIPKVQFLRLLQGDGHETSLH